jgi:hypothetical protein
MDILCVLLFFLFDQIWAKFIMMMISKKNRKAKKDHLQVTGKSCRNVIA